MEQTDEEKWEEELGDLVDQIKQGNKESASLFVDHYSHLMTRYARKYISSPAMAKHTAQSAFVAFLSHLDSIESGKADIYLRNTVHKNAISFLKSQWMKQEETEDDEKVEPIEETPLSADRKHALEEVYSRDESGMESNVVEVLDALPDKERTVVVLRYLEGFDYAEIAKMLRFDEDKAKALEASGKVNIQKHLSSASEDSFWKDKDVSSFLYLLQLTGRNLPHESDEQVLGDTAVMAVMEAQKDEVSEKKEELPEEYTPAARKNRKKWIIPLVIAAAAGAGIYYYVSSRPTIYQLQVIPVASGYDGYGTLTLNLDRSDTGNEVMNEVLRNATVTVSETDHVSNGDVVNYAISYNHDQTDSINYQIEGAEGSFTVDGLTELKDIDLFKGVTVEWSPNYEENYIDIVMKASSQNEAGIRVDYTPKAPDDNNQVTVSVSFDADALAAKGYKCAETTKVFDLGEAPDVFRDDRQACEEQDGSWDDNDHSCNAN